MADRQLDGRVDDQEKNDISHDPYGKHNERGSNIMRYKSKKDGKDQEWI